MNARDQRSMTRIVHAAKGLKRQDLRLEDAPPVYERSVAKLQSSATRLRVLAYEQYKVSPTIAHEGSGTEYLRKRLRREYMIPLTRTGRPLFRFATGIEKALAVPHARASHRKLVAAAEQMLKVVRPHQKLLVEAGFRPTFLTEFRELTRELKRIATTSSARQKKFARVTDELHEELASANETLGILEGFVLARSVHDPSFAKHWKKALRPPKRLGRPPAKKRKSGPNEGEAQG